MTYSKLAVFSAIVAVALGAPVTSNSTGVITVPLTKVRQTGPQSNLTRRSTFGESLQYTGYRYFAEYTIGGQTQSAILDTGSSDTWTFSNHAWKGGFDPEESSTWTWLNDNFKDGYGGSGTDNVAGTWGTDTVGIGGAKVPNYQVGLLNQSSPDFPDNRGILAFGPKAAESANPQYPTYAERLKEAGIIQSNSFSLFSDASNDAATLLIGGIDTAKYSGPLYTIPLDLTELYGSVYYSVDFEYDGQTYPNGVLDTGTPVVLLPQAQADALAIPNGYQYDPQSGYYLREGPPPASQQPDIEIKLGGIPITIPGSQSYFDGGDNIYFFAISRNINEIFYTLNILGDPLLRQLFLFFDVDKEQIAFAPVVQTEDSSPVAVGSTIPGATPAPDQTVGDPNGGIFF